MNDEEINKICEIVARNIWTSIFKDVKEMDAYDIHEKTIEFDRIMKNIIEELRNIK